MLNATMQEFKDDPIDRDLVQFASIAHDLGHPPFGHNGEKALDELMKDHGGFEGNAQTLRILVSSEKKLVSVNGNRVSSFGLDLTFRSLASVLKYDRAIPDVRKSTSALSKGYYTTEQLLVEQIKHSVAPGFSGEKFKTIECSIMDLADDIAYSTCDLEDSLHAGFVTFLSLLHALLEDRKVIDAVFTKTNAALLESGHDEMKDRHEMVDFAIKRFAKFTAIPNEWHGDQSPNTLTTIQAIKSHGMDQLMSNDPLLRTKYTQDRIATLINSAEVGFDPESPPLSNVRLKRVALMDVEILKHLNFELVIRSPRLAVVEHRGKDIVKQLFSAVVQSEGDLLPTQWKRDYCAASSRQCKCRVVCDFIAGMTDSYAVEFHDALFGDGKSLYKPI